MYNKQAGNSMNKDDAISNVCMDTLNSRLLVHILNPAMQHGES